MSNLLFHRNIPRSTIAGKVRGGSEVRFATIKGHAHIWPGGENLLPESWVGKASGKFHATDAILLSK